MVCLKRHGPLVAFYFYCNIMLYGINYTYYSVKTVKLCFMYHLGVEIDAVRALNSVYISTTRRFQNRCRRG